MEENNTNNSPSRQLTIGPAADFLNISIDTLRRWERQDKISSSRNKRGYRLYEISDLMELKASQGVSISDAAEFMGVSASTLRRYEREGIIKPQRNEKNERIYTREGLVSAREAIKMHKVAISQKAKEKAQAPSSFVAPTERGEFIAKESQIIHHRTVFAEAPASEFEPQSLREKAVEPISLSQEDEEVASAEIPVAEPEITSKRSFAPVFAFASAFIFLFVAAFTLGGMVRDGQKVAELSDEQLLVSMGQSSIAGFVLNSGNGDERVLASIDDSVESFFEVNLPSFFADDVTIEGQLTAPNIVNSIQGQTGDVSLTAGEGIIIDGTTISSTVTEDAQNTFSGLTVGSETALADAADDQLTVAAGDNITVSLDAASDTLTIAATDNDTTYSAGDNLTLDGTTFDLDDDVLNLGGDLSGTVGSATIADGVIEFSNISASDTAADEECLTYEAGTGGFQWEACAGGGGISSLTLSADSGSDQTLSDGDTIEIAGGDGLASVAGATDTVTLNIDLLDSADGTGATSSNSGLELQGASSDELALLQGCADNEVLKWDDTNNVWECAADNAGGGGANSFETINAPSGTDPVADSATDTLAFTSDNSTVTITGNSTTDTIDFDAVDLNCTDCLNATEIEDIYVLIAGDAMTGALTNTADDTDNYVPIQLTQNDTTNNPNTATFTNAGTGSGLQIDQNGAGLAFNIDAAGDADVVDIVAENVGFTNDILVLQANEEGSGNFEFLKLINDADGTPDTVLTINEDGSIYSDGVVNIGGIAETGEVTYNAFSSGTGSTGHSLSSAIDLYVEGSGEFDGTLYTDGGLTGVGIVDFGEADSVEVPSGTGPTIDAAGEIAIDTDADGDLIDQGLITYYDGTTQLYAVAIDSISGFSDNDVLTYDAATDKFVVEAASAASVTLQDAYDASSSAATITLSSSVDGLEIDNPSASGTDSSQTFLIDQNATTGVDGIAVDSEATDSSALVINHVGDTSTANAAGVSITAESGAGGLYVYRNQAGATTDDALVFFEEDGAADTNVLAIQNDGTGDGLFVDQNGAGYAIEVDAENTTQDIARINGDALTTGDGLVIDSTNTTLSSGELLRLDYTMSGATTTNKTGALASITGDRTDTFTFSSLSDDYDLLQLNRNSTINGIGTVFSATGSVLRLANTAVQTSGVLSDSVVLAELVQDADSTGDGINIDYNPTATGNALEIDSESSAASILVDQSGDGDVVDITASNTVFSNSVLKLSSNEEDTGSFNFLELISDADGIPDTELTINQDGDIATDGNIVATSYITSNDYLGINIDSDANNILNTSAGTATADDLYWGDDLLCDVSETDCGWSTGGGGVSDLQGAYDGGNTIEILPATGSTIITETTATASQTTDLLQLTINPATGGDTSGDALQITLDAVDTASSTGAGLHIISDVSQATGDLILAEDDAANEFFSVGISNAIFNEAGLDRDFRIEGTDEANALFVQGSDGFVGIGTASPDSSLHVYDQGTATSVIIESEDVSLYQALLVFHSAGAEVAHAGLESGGGFVLENDQQDKDITFTVNDGGVDVNLLSLDASTSRIGVNTTGPSSLLEIEDTSSDPIVSIQSNTTGSPTLRFGDTGGWPGSIVYDNVNNDLTFSANGTEALTIDSAGEVGIGDTTPAAALVVGSDAGAGTANGAGDVFIQNDLEVDGVVQLGDSTSVEITNGSAPTVNAAGEIAIDTTDGQVKYYDGTAERVLTYEKKFSTTLESPSDSDNFNLMKAPHAITITDIECVVDPADTSESVVIDVQERDSTADNPATVDATITCDNDGAADDGALSNGTIDAGDWISIDIGTVTGTVTQLTVTVTYTIDGT